MGSLVSRGAKLPESTTMTVAVQMVTGGAVLLDVYSLGAFEKREEGTKCEPNLLHGFWFQT